MDGVCYVVDEGGCWMQVDTFETDSVDTTMVWMNHYRFGGCEVSLEA